MGNTAASLETTFKKNDDISVSILENILIKATFAASKQDANDILCEMWHIFNGIEKNEKLLVVSIKFQINVLQKIFENAEFQRCLSEVNQDRERMKLENQDLKRLMSDKKYIEKIIILKLFLEIGLFPITFLLTEVDPVEFRGAIKSMLRKICCDIGNCRIHTISLLLAEILKESGAKHKFKFDQFIPFDGFHTDLIKVSRLGHSLLVLGIQIEVIGECFLRISAYEKDNRPNLYLSLKEIHGVTFMCKKTIEAVREFSIDKEIRQFFSGYIFSNEIVLIAALQSISKGLNDGNFNENLLKKIDDIEMELTLLRDLAEKELQAFAGERSGEYEWANKVYLTTIKTLSAYSAINNAIDIKWKMSVAIRELYIWIDEVNKIINRYLINDDWMELLPFIQGDIENKEIEWKSTFYMSIEGNTKIEKNKQLLKSVADTILAMYNSNGGTIIIGLVERPKEVKAVMKKFLQKKQGYTFFNIEQELEIFKTSLDNVRRDIQELLSKISGSSIGEFDEYWTINPLRIFIQNGNIVVVRIDIKESPAPFISSEGSKIFIRKRIKGRNANIDPRDVFKLNKI